MPRTRHFLVFVQYTSTQGIRVALSLPLAFVLGPPAYFPSHRQVADAALAEVLNTAAVFVHVPLAGTFAITGVHEVTAAERDAWMTEQPVLPVLPPGAPGPTA